MKKDAYYFPHFSNARNDSKILKLRRILGAEGYAVYFMLLEILREQTDWRFPLSGIPELEFEMRVSKEKIVNVIMDYDLFEVDKTNNFFSPKLIQYLQPYIEKSQKARESAKIRWNNANALPPHNERNASKGEESKVKETKEEKSKVHDAGAPEITPLPFESKDFWNAWIEWCQYKKERKQKFTTRTKEMQLRKLGARPESEAIEMIRQSIENGWTGLFELKTDSKRPSATVNGTGRKLIDLTNL